MDELCKKASEMAEKFEWHNQIRQPDIHQLKAAENYYTEFLKALGIWDVMEAEPKSRTPARVVHAFVEFFGANLEPINFTTFPNPAYERENDGLVVVNDIQFSSLCSHHLLPYLGVCHVGYVPDALVVGISKLPRIVSHATHGATIQEDVVESIADFLESCLQSRGVIVMMEATHTCLSCRGVRAPGTTIRTLAVRGCFNDDDIMTDRFLTMVK